MSGGSLRERLGTLSRAELAGLVVLLALLLGGAGLWYVRSLPRPVQVRTEPVPLAVPAPGPGSASPSPTVLLVDVAGWVRRPGVYEFREGARIVDAIEAAGGARPGAALEMLNLAAPLADGTQVLVVKAGAAPAPAPGAPAAPGAAGAPGGLVNVNTASATELEALPGIGEVIAQRIIDHRTANGPFASVEELLEVSGIGEAILGSIRELVTV
ncbi:MAG TPA: ComEA family DNA-binding protein [Actinomycetota bacterium]|nr:ComEA family DNA-binding protein [Actinomycetota bacterium]